MILGFEDIFTAIQSDTIALCLEYLENSDIHADKVYVYFYQSEYERVFNAFFLIGKEVKTSGEIADEEDSDAFLDVGLEDLEKLIEASEKYDHPCPNEFKLVYNVKSKAFDADYQYEDYSEKGEISPDEVLIKWINQVKNEV